jgi:hypothetical protein
MSNPLVCRGSKLCLAVTNSAAGTEVTQTLCPYGWKDGSSSDDDDVINDQQMWAFKV